MNVDGLHSHRDDKLNWEDGFGSSMILPHLPVKGVYGPSPPPLPNLPNPGTRANGSSSSVGGSHSERLPKLPFPEFDGENPILWLSRCEDYFEMYNIEPH
jgi:hypothetical protein